MKKSFGKDFLYYLPAQIAPALVGFISIPLATRLFSPEQYGGYMLVLSTVIILNALSGWLPIAIIRFFRKSLSEKYDFLTLKTFNAPLY